MKNKNHLPTAMKLGMVFFALVQLMVANKSVAQVAPSEAASQPIRLGAPSKPVPKPKPLTTSDFYGIGFALDNVDHFGMSKNLEAQANMDFWRNPISLTGVQKFTSKDQQQFVEYSRRESGKYDLVALNKKTARTTITVFGSDNRPESYTIVGPNGEYSATPAFCEILKSQTNSKNFKELAATAVTCKDFYSRPPIDSTMATSMQKHIDTHRANVELLKNSVAGPMLPKSNESFLKSLMKYWGNEDDTRSKDYRKPRAILSRTSSVQDIEDRQQIADLAVACDRLWTDGDGAADVAPAKSAVKDPSAN